LINITFKSQNKQVFANIVPLRAWKCSPRACDRIFVIMSFCSVRLEDQLAILCSKA